MEFLGWLCIWGAIVGGLTKLSYQIVPPPKRNTVQLDPFPLAPRPGDRSDNWIDVAVARKAAQLVRVMPPPPPQTIAETPENTGNTPPEHTTEHAQNTPLEHRNTPPEHDDDFGEPQWEAVWRAIESGERSKSAIIRSVWGNGVNKSGKPGSQWKRCSEFIAGVIAEYERSGLERIERAYQRS